MRGNWVKSVGAKWLEKEKGENGKQEWSNKIINRIIRLNSMKTVVLLNTKIIAGKTARETK